MNMGEEKPRSDDRAREHGRSRSHRRKRFRLGNWLAEMRWRFLNWFLNWWYAPSDDASPDQEYYGHSRRSRVSKIWRRVRRGFRELWLGKLFRAISTRLYDWWYPPSQESSSYPGHGYRASRRRSRFALARRRLQRRFKQSPFARWSEGAYSRFYEWWYPVTKSPYPYLGYHGPKRRSRPVVLWRDFRHSVRNSPLGKGHRRILDRLHEWWYPPTQSSSRRYPNSNSGQVSRPILAFRRWRRWFLSTWIGREFGWIIEESIVLFYFLRSEIAEALAWRRIKKFFSKKLNVAAMVILIAAGVAGYRYSMPRYRAYVEQQYARQADQYVKKRDFHRAYLRAHQVLELNPDNSTATRVNADLSDWANLPYALYWRQRTVALAPSSTSRLALAATAIRLEQAPYPTAAKALAEVDPECRLTASYHLVAGALALKLNQIGEAEKHYAEALRIQPDNPVTRMSLAVLQLQSKNPNIIRDSRMTLELLNTDGKLGILPMRSLVAQSIASQDYARAEQISSQILTNAQAAFGDRLLHLTILHNAARTNFQGFLKETQQKAMERPVYIGELASWLNQYGFSSQAITWLRGLPRETASQALIPLALADSYATLKQWKEMEDYLDGEQWSGMEHIRIAMLSYAIKNQADKERAIFSWDRAVRLASENPGALSILAQTALSWGWIPEADQVLWRSATKFPKDPWALMMLQNLYTVRRDTVGLRRAYQTLMRQDPKDKLARNNFAMVSLLSGYELPTAHGYAAELYAAEPANPIFASTYAFSLHLQGKSKEGLAVLRALKPAELADPGLAVYYGILLAAVGDIKASKDYLGMADKAVLLPEEVALVTSAKARGKNGG